MINKFISPYNGLHIRSCSGLLILISALIAACSRPKQQQESFDFKPPTVVEAKPYRVPAEKLAPPIVVPVSNIKTIPMGRPKIINLNPNLYKNVYEPEIKKILPMGTPKLITPGKDGFKLPVKVPAIDSPFEAGAPEIILLKDFYVKDDNPESFSTMGTMHGFLSNDLNALYVDRAGNLWVGGWDGGGLSKYDGRYLTNYSAAQGLSSNAVLSVLEDRDGNIWTVTDGDVLNKFDGKYFTRYTTKQGLSNDNLGKIIEGKNGDIWIGTNKGLNRYDGHSFHYYTKEQGLPNDSIYSMANDSKGNIWITTAGHGFLKFDGQKFHDYTGIFGSGIGHFLAEDREDNLWMRGLGNNYVFRYDGKTMNQYSIKGDKSFPGINDLFADRAGNLWISTSDGFFKYDGKFLIHFSAEHGLGDKWVRMMREDAAGNIWYCTNTGVGKFDGKFFNHIQWFQGIGKAGLTSVAADDSGHIWIGTWGAGVSKYDGKSISIYTRDQGLGNNDIEDILKDRSGNLWITTTGGLDRFDGKLLTEYTRKSGLLSDFIYCLLQDRNGNIWMGSYAGVSKFDGKSFTNYTMAQGLSGNVIICMYEDHNGHIWFGTRDNGVTVYDGSAFIHYNRSTGLSDATINSICEDKDEMVWLATDEGVNRFDGKFFTWYTTEQGLTKNKVNNVFKAKNGDLWISTVDGLNKLNPESNLSDTGHKTAYIFKRYTRSEGFLGVGTYWNSITEDSKGNLWFGTNGRITNYHPEGDIPDTVPPTLQLTGIRLFNQRVNWYDLAKKKDTTIILNDGATIKDFEFSGLSRFYSQPENLKLTYKNNYITFQFIGVTTNRPKEVQYKYFLEGVDDRWSVLSSQPEATYNNLSPGTYTFRVKAANSEGFWSKELSYQFTISPPWWKTWWAYTLFAIAIITILFGTIRWFLQQKYRSQLEKSEKEKEIAEIRQKAGEMEMQALRAQMNPHFIFNSLNSINRFILQNNRAQASEYLTKFSKLVRMILQNSQASLISLESELESLNLYLDLEAVRFEHRFAYKISYPKDLDIEVLKVPPLVIQPFTENAIWHGLMHKEDKGQLDIDVSEEDDYLYIKITDNGIGRKKAGEIASKSATKHKSMGLRITKDRIAMLQRTNGSESPVKIIDLEHEDGTAAGTEVIIKMPAIYE